MSSKKILIVNFGGIGDILNTTAIATHYKSFEENFHVSFLTKSKYRFALENNSQIDSVLTLNPELDAYEPLSLSNEFKTNIQRSSIKTEDFLKIIFAAPYMSPFYDLTSRSTLLKIIMEESSQISDWNVSFMPHVELSEEQIQEARLFKQKIPNNFNVLIEYEFFSNQSFINEFSILKILKTLKQNSLNLIFSGLKKPEYYNNFSSIPNFNVFHYDKSFMSNAELYNNIDFFIGCSSGITCLTSSDYCDPNIPRIELVRGEHWSTKDFTHHKNKNIVYNLEGIKE